MKDANMKPKIKTILIGILIGVIAFPTITLGGTFISSLIQGKTIEEAVQILAEQVDSLIGRVKILEVKQSKNELWQEKEDVCNKARDYLDGNMPTGYDWYLLTITDKEKRVARLEAKIILPTCQEYPSEYTEENNNCATIEAKESWKQHLEINVRPELERLRLVEEKYRLLKQGCDESTSRYDELYGTSE